MFGTTVGFGGGALNAARGVLSEGKCKSKKGCKQLKKRRPVKESTAPTSTVINQPILKAMPTLAVIQPKYNIRLR